MTGIAIVNQNRKKHNPLKILSPPDTQSQDNSIDVASWIRFLRELRIPGLFASLTDVRQPGKTVYPLQSLLMWAFSGCAFRTGSKNALHTSLSSLHPHQREGMLNLLGLKSGRLPHISTVDNALANLSLKSLSMIPINLVKQLEKRKFFYNHPELLPNNTLCIACDGFHTHTYDHPHATHEDGTNACPYCLPRKRHKGTEKETTYWVHVSITVALICNGMTLPLYFYPLKALQVNSEQSDEKLKEECELKATYAILPMIREAFPRIPILFLGDALYANRPMIRLCNDLKIDYLIVFKEGSLKKLNEKCNELSELDLYQKHYTHKIKEVVNSQTIEKQANWFNTVDIGEGVCTNVLRYKEIHHHKDGICEPGYAGGWITSKKLSSGNCFKIAQQGRMRWEHEDMHNTLNNRGYNMQHDMAWTNPHLALVWRLLTVIAHTVFTLFQCTTAAQAVRGSRSVKKFAQDLLQQLLSVPWKIIEQSHMLFQGRVQFRYRFEDY